MEDFQVNSSNWFVIIRRFFKYFMGPGWLISLTYIDPGNIEADLQCGAFTGYKLVWVTLLAHIIGFFFQSLAATLGVVTRRSLAQLCRYHYSRPLNLSLWLMTEIAIVGTDVQQVLGTSIALKMLFGWPLWTGCLVTALDTVWLLLLQIFKGMRFLEFLVCIIVFVVGSCFFVDWVNTAPEGMEIIKGAFLPQLPSYAFVQVVSMLGSIVMPHSLHLHSAIVAEKTIPASSASAIPYFVFDAAVSLFASFLINLTVQSSMAASFFNEKCALNPSTPLGCLPDASILNTEDCELLDCTCVTRGGLPGVCSSVGLSNAGSSLAAIMPYKGAVILFAFGILAAGQASTLSSTIAGQYVMEGFLSLSMPPWMRVAVTRFAALLPAVCIAVASSSSNSAMNSFNSWLNILQAFQLPFTLIPLLHFLCGSGSIKDSIYPWVRYAAYLVTLGLLGINYMLIMQQFGDEFFFPKWLIFLCCSYFSLIIAILWADFKGILYGDNVMPTKTTLTESLLLERT